MKIKIIKTNIYLLLLVTLSSCIINNKKTEEITTSYQPVDQELYNTIQKLDSTFFKAYNTCDLETQRKMISKDLEFYHDQGGLTTSKEDLIEALKNNICGKVTRTLIEGSVEVYPIPNYGAVQIGQHKFYNNQEPDAISKPSKFVVLWKQENDIWLMARVVSLH